MHVLSFFTSAILGHFEFHSAAIATENIALFRGRKSFIVLYVRSHEVSNHMMAGLK